MNKDADLISLGIDIGTTTTQLVISRLSFENVMPGCQLPKLEITQKSVIYLGNVYFTPFLDRLRVDGAALRDLIASEYKMAGISLSDIDMGAIIITGEAAKKENASEIIHSLAEYAGNFVVAAAGPNLESLIAGKGSGAEELSRNLRSRLVNIDIGGGTSNIAFFDCGVPVGTACLDIGARLFEVDQITHRVSYVAPLAKRLVKALESKYGKMFFPAATAQEEENNIRICLKSMVDALVKVVFQEPLNGEEQYLLRTNSLPRLALDSVVFSGGVAKYIYRPDKINWWLHGDVGPLLAGECAKSRCFTDLKVHQGKETLHATVIGAGTHTVNLSGSTVLVSKNALPLRNIPAVYPEKEADGKTFTWLKQAKNFENCPYKTLALVVPPLSDTDYDTITALADNLAMQFKQINKKPFIVIISQDLAKVLGQNLSRRLPNEDLVCLDGINLNFGDFLDIARPLKAGEAVPVIVKTLVFS